VAHIVHIEVPEDIYESLLKTSEQTGQPPEELIVEWLSTVARYMIDDPVEEFIGAFESGIPDLAEQHDAYIGKALAAKLDTSHDTTLREPDV
jgi:hypothetical protein